MRSVNANIQFIWAFNATTMSVVSFHIKAKVSLMEDDFIDRKNKMLVKV